MLYNYFVRMEVLMEVFLEVFLEREEENCIFCSIIEGKQPAYVLEESEMFLVILDIFPLRPGHTLIIAKRHVKFIEDLTKNEREALIDLINKFSGKIKNSGLNVKATQIILNNGKEANQTIPHLHFHIIPRYGFDFPILLFHLITRFFNPYFRFGNKKRLKKVLEQLI